MSGRCEQVQPLLGEYLMGALDSPQEVAITAHLDECVECGKVLAEVQGLADALVAAPTSERDTHSMATQEGTSPQSQAGQDVDIEFGKYLIGQGALTPEQVREAYKLLVGYRERLPNVNLAQVLARHGMGTKEDLRDHYTRFRGASMGGSAVGSAVGSGVGSGEVVGDTVGWSNTSPSETQNVSQYGACTSWK